MAGDAFAANEVRLLLNVLAYNLVHAARVLAEQATGQGWGLARFREVGLRVAGRVLIHGRRAVLVVGEGAARLWHALWPHLMRQHTYRAGSPTSRALFAVAAVTEATSGARVCAPWAPCSRVCLTNPLHNALRCRRDRRGLANPKYRLRKPHQTRRSPTLRSARE